MTTPVNFASGSNESYPIRYAQDLSGTFDVTWINFVKSVATKDSSGNLVDFNQDGLTDASFIGGRVDQYIGYTNSDKGDGAEVSTSRSAQGEVALGGGRNGGQSLEVIDSGIPDSSYAGMPVEAILGSFRSAVVDLDDDGY